MSDIIGKSIDRYHILEQLGEGGMATVYKAFDTRLERDVAIKIIRRNAFPPDQLDRILKRFEREAKSLARLSHPNIIKVIDYGEYTGAPYLVMEYMPGGTLKEKLKGKAMQWQEAVRLLIPIAQALEYAHEQKIIHRDIKPSNILLMQKGQPMLTDFGIAKILEVEETATLTGTGVGVGTPEYMAPEQWTGSATAQTDIYSLGVVLYEMVTGRKPYTADTPAAILLKQATEPLPRPGTYVSDLPDAVEKILVKALARKPKDRYQDTGVFVTAMENLLMGAGQKPVSTPSVRNPIEPDLETQDTYIQEEINSTKSQTGTYTEAPRKTRTTQTMNLSDRSQPKKAIWWPWAIGLGGLVLLVFVTNIFNSNIFSPVATVMPTSETGNDGMTLLYVPAGEFIMGSDTGSEAERPAHIVYLDAYWIDQTEVTNKQYSACEASGGCTSPSTSSSDTNTSYYDNSQFDDYPVIYVDWNQAKAYCEWAERRLPTEAEWENAARGPDANIFPWGNTFDGSKLNFCDVNCTNVQADKSIDDGYTEVSPVGSYPNGLSAYGALDMAGNVWEWVNDWYGETYYQSSSSSNPLGVSSGDARVLRGGSWAHDGDRVHSAYRVWDDPRYTDNFLGFRCARSQ